MALRCQREPPRLQGACVDGEPRREGRDSSGRTQHSTHSPAKFSRGAREFTERLAALPQLDIINSLKLAGWHYCSLEKKNEGETDRLLPDLFLVGHGEE